MTDCAQLEQRLDAYLAGRITTIEAESLEAHASTCERCAALLEAGGRLPLGLLPEVAPPAGLRAQVLWRVRGAARRRRLVRVALPTALAATLVLGFGLVRPADKVAMGPTRASGGPLAVARARAVPEFEALTRARREVDAALTGASAEDRPRLEAERARLARQHDRLVTLVQEFES